MQDYEMTYYLDLKDRKNRERIASAKPGASIRVLVRLAADRNSPPIDAQGTLSEDSEDFTVRVKTATGMATHSRGWAELNEDIASHDKFD